MEEYENYISVALLLLLAILQPHRWKNFEKFFVRRTDLDRKMKWLMRGKTLRVTVTRGSDKPHAD